MYAGVLGSRQICLRGYVLVSISYMHSLASVQAVYTNELASIVVSCAKAEAYAMRSVCPSMCHSLCRIIAEIISRFH